ncbi:hypothetical protein HDV00_006209 [Rhizophlyctis rosea]|nr:hypothetical protein HDV00_006209 [Rhizophlyctis rosea]
MDDLEFRKLVQEHGGNISPMLAIRSVTHMICTRLCDRKIEKLRNTKSLKIVRPQWVLDSIQNGKRLAEKGYFVLNEETQTSLTTMAFRVADGVGCMDEATPAYETDVLDCNIEQWVHLLGPELTFATAFVPLTPDHARLLIEAYTWSTLPENQNAVEAAAQAYSDEGDLPFLNRHEEQLYKTLGSSIQTAMDSMQNNGPTSTTGCFVKTSSRSAKDAAARSGAFRHIYKSALSTLIANNTTTKNDKMKALCDAEMGSLRYKDARRVIRALCLSERVWQDMMLALKHEDRWKENVVVRGWEEIDVDMEFRTFVYKGNLTAVSQYAYGFYSPRLPTLLPQIRQTLTNFYTSTLQNLLSTNGFANCVVDFAILLPTPPSPPTEWRVKVVEINPFWETTDGALFSWNKERDLLEGRSVGLEYPLVRVTEAAREGALVMVPGGWKKVAEEVERECGVEGVFR